MGAPEVNLWENVAQVEIFSDVEVPRKKRAVFAGNLSPHKVDFSLLEELLDSGIELVVAGPRGIDGSTELDGMRRVLDHPRCEYVGNLSIPELARVLPSCMVGLIPYQINDYTNGVFPMKVYEYLAAGLTVVTTPLPSLDQPINGLRIADANTFVDEVESALTGWDEYQSEASRKEAVGHSWTDRVRSANALIDGCAG
ncbi:hypothetical protein GOALK_054_00020 [Gordonia alkanivorans NBRC 16433]|uniref:Glycosyltransferase n=2 Tax=Gordonia alkanivorans TaxID=84096 RepID=F9VVB9_9ACTN|nr:hypothetical protein GOALK_054_00020 [Gordonia alkanivorans NBRC 16433]